MRIVTLMENTSCREELCPEHGLSLYIETERCKILFDMGKTSAFSVKDHQAGGITGLCGGLCDRLLGQIVIKIGGGVGAGGAVVVDHEGFLSVLAGVCRLLS